MKMASFLPLVSPSGFENHFILRLMADNSPPLLVRIKFHETALLAPFTKVIFLIFLPSFQKDEI